jgi:hypothetical protein
MGNLIYSNIKYILPQYFFFIFQFCNICVYSAVSQHTSDSIVVVVHCICYVHLQYGDINGNTTAEASKVYCINLSKEKYRALRNLSYVTDFSDRKTALRIKRTLLDNDFLVNIGYG